MSRDVFLLAAERGQNVNEKNPAEVITETFETRSKRNATFVKIACTRIRLRKLRTNLRGTRSHRYRQLESTCKVLFSFVNAQVLTKLGFSSSLVPILQREREKRATRYMYDTTRRFVFNMENYVAQCVHSCVSMTN